MKLKMAIITDIHGNLEALTSILADIKSKKIDKIICLGDTIGIGPDSKKCIDLIMKNNIDMVLGNHELYCIKGTKIDSSIMGEEKNHHEWIKKSLSSKELEFIKKCPLSYEYEIKYDNKNLNKKIIFSHYLINNINDYNPFEKTHLKNNIDLWIKYNDPSIFYVLGHLHQTFDENEVEGIKGDYIEKTGELTNIMLVGSGGCSYSDKVSYIIIDINKSINFKTIIVKFDRKTFVNKISNTNFPDKNNILSCFYGIKSI